MPSRSRRPPEGARAGAGGQDEHTSQHQKPPAKCSPCAASYRIVLSLRRRLPSVSRTRGSENRSGGGKPLTHGSNCFRPRDARKARGAATRLQTMRLLPSWGDRPRGESLDLMGLSPCRIEQFVEGGAVRSCNAYYTAEGSERYRGAATVLVTSYRAPYDYGTATNHQSVPGRSRIVRVELRDRRGFASRPERSKFPGPPTRPGYGGAGGYGESDPKRP